VHILLKDLAARTDAIRISGQVDLSEAAANSQDLLAIEPAQAELTARYAEGVAIVEGEASVLVTQSCSRCLTPVRQTITVPIRELFTQKPEVADSDEDEDIHLVESDRIDLEPYVEENVLVALPYAPLCGEDCKGLCPNCGTNRNERDCGCSTERVDPRLAGLADFFKE